MDTRNSITAINFTIWVSTYYRQHQFLNNMWIDAMTGKDVAIELMWELYNAQLPV